MNACPGPASPQTFHTDVPNPDCPECGSPDETFEQQVLGALMRIDRLGQDHYSRSLAPLAGTGSGDLYKAIGLREASNMLRQLLGMPRHPGFSRDQ